MSTLTSYVQLTVMCVLYLNLSCFSIGVLLNFSADSDKLIILCMMASQKLLVLHLSLTILTLPTLNDSATVASCMAESSHFKMLVIQTGMICRFPLVSCWLYLICQPFS